MQEKKYNRKNSTLLEQFKMLAEKYTSMAVFNISAISVAEMETIRKIAREGQVGIRVIKNTIFNKAISGITSKLKGNMMITYADNPASCVSFLNKVKPKKLRDKLVTAFVFNTKSNSVCAIPVDKLIQMNNADGIKSSLIGALKSTFYPLINVLKAVGN